MSGKRRYGDGRGVGNNNNYDYPPQPAAKNHGGGHHVAQMQVEQNNDNDVVTLPCSPKQLSCTMCLVGVGLLIAIIGIPTSFFYIGYNEYAFQKNTLTNFVDTTTVYTEERQFWGWFREKISFDKTYQVVSFRGDDLMVFSRGNEEGETGIEFSIDCDVFYRLGTENLSSIYTDMALTYPDRIKDEIFASIKKSAPKFSLPEYFSKRPEIEQTMLDDLNENLAELFIGFEPRKFSLLRTVFPPENDAIYLNTAVQALQNDKAKLEEVVRLIEKETEEQERQVRANITIVNQVADAAAAARVKEGHAEADKISEEATGQGLNHFRQNLTLTDPEDWSRALRLMAIMDNPTSPKILVGTGMNTLINV